MTTKVARGPKGAPIVGNALQMRGIDALDYWQGLHQSYGETVKLKLGPLHAWSFASPQAIHEILVTQHKNMRKGMGYAGLRMLLGEGLITTDEQHWADERKRLNPIFTPTAIDNYSSAILDACNAGIPELEELAAGKQPVDIGRAMTRLTMRVVSRATFGVDLGAGPNDIVDAFDFAFAYIADISVNPLRLPIFVPTARNKKYQKALATIETFTEELIERSTKIADLSEMNGKVFAALSGIDRKLLRDEVISLYFAGFETTARTMTFMMDVLSRQPKILAELRAETDKAGDLSQVASVPKALPVASEIVNETLRLYPPVAMMARQPNEDCEIDGYAISANSLVVINPYIAQRNVEFWPDGDEFAPNADMPLPKRLTHRGAFAPFGAGPRMCLGKHFALVEMALAISIIAQRFDWSLPDPTPLELGFYGTLRPQKPIMVNLAVREH